MRLSPGGSTFCCCLLKRLCCCDGRPGGGEAVRCCGGTLDVRGTGDHLRTVATFTLSRVCLGTGGLRLVRRCLLITTVSSIASTAGRGMTLRSVTLFVCGRGAEDLGGTRRCVGLSLRSTCTCGGQLHHVRVSSGLRLVAGTCASSVGAAGELLGVTLLIVVLLLLKMNVDDLFVHGGGELLGRGGSRVATASTGVRVLGKRLRLVGSRLGSAGRGHRELMGICVSLYCGGVREGDGLHALMMEGVGTGRDGRLLDLLSSSAGARGRGGRFLARFSGTFLSLCPAFVDRLGRRLARSTRVRLGRGKRVPPVLHIYTLLQLNVARDSGVTNVLSCSPRAMCGCHSVLGGGTVSGRRFRRGMLGLYVVVTWSPLGGVGSEGKLVARH